MKRSAAALLLFGVLFLVTPPEHGFRICGFYALTGLLCPLCGLTHGVFALAKGDWAAAIHWNALTPIGFAMLFSLFWNHPVRGRLWAAGIPTFAVYGLWRCVSALIHA